MLAVDVRAARAAWTVFLLALAIFLVYAIRGTLLVFMAALFFAYMLAPVVNVVQSRLPAKVAHTVSLTIVYLVLLGVIITVGGALGGYIVDEATSLANLLPELLKQDWKQSLPLPEWLEPMRLRIISAVQDEVSNGGRNLMPYFQRAGRELVSGAGNLLYVVLVPILAFFFLKDGPRLRVGLVDAFAGSSRALVEDILTDVNIMLGQYIRALVILSASTFSLYILFLSVSGAPYAVLLSLIAAVLEFIPVVGPFSAGMIVLVVTGFSGYPHLVWFALFWVVSRMFQDYVLSPYLMSTGVELHPLLVLFGVLAGEQLAGIPGMFFSVPILAILRVVWVQGARTRRRQELVDVAG